MDGYGIVCAPKGDGVIATLFFPKFLNAYFVSIIGNLVQLRVDSGIKICSRRIIVTTAAKKSRKPRNSAPIAEQNRSSPSSPLSGSSLSSPSSSPSSRNPNRSPSSSNPPNGRTPSSRTLNGRPLSSPPSGRTLRRRITAEKTIPGSPDFPSFWQPSPLWS